MSRRRVEGRVRAIGRGGDAIVETADGIVLVAGGLPGETIELEPGRRQRGATRGRLTRVLDPSPARRNPPCVDAERCGGCPLMNANLELQRQVKESFLREAYEGLPGSSETEVRWVASPRALGYRRRARLAWHGDLLGYRRRRSKQVVDIESCIVVAAPLSAAWAAAREHLCGHLVGKGEITLLRSEETASVALRSRSPQPSSAFGACARLAEDPRVEGVSLRDEEAAAAAEWGRTSVALRSEGALLWAPSEAFSQANEAINDRLVHEVVALAQPTAQRVLELHAGIGNFTVALAREAESLVAVEHDERAAEACRQNLASRSLDARVLVGDANDPPTGRYDVLVLDPPRQGAKALFERDQVWPTAKRIVYVSCDTATLGRDLRSACAHGYRIDAAVGLDMFPQTAHLESVVRLVR